MALRKPTLSVQEARRMASDRPDEQRSPDSSLLQDKPVAHDKPVSQDKPMEHDKPVSQDRPVVKDKPVIQELPPTPALPLVEQAVAEPVVVALPVLPSPPPPVVVAPQIMTPPPAAPSPRTVAATPEPSSPEHDFFSGPRVQVFVSAAVPAPGVSASFDLLSRQYPPGKALQMILRRALDDYEEMLADGTYRGRNDAYESEATISRQTIIQTSRIMPQQLVDIARQHFDPLGFESTRAFGQKLASAALAAFFHLEATIRR